MRGDSAGGRSGRGGRALGNSGCYNEIISLGVWSMGIGLKSERHGVCSIIRRVMAIAPR